MTVLPPPEDATSSISRFSLRELHRRQRLLQRQKAEFGQSRGDGQRRVEIIAAVGVGPDLRLRREPANELAQFEVERRVRPHFDVKVPIAALVGRGDVGLRVIEARRIQRPA